MSAEATDVMPAPFQAKAMLDGFGVSEVRSVELSHCRMIESFYRSKSKLRAAPMPRPDPIRRHIKARVAVSDLKLIAEIVY